MLHHASLHTLLSSEKPVDTRVGFEYDLKVKKLDVGSENTEDPATLDENTHNRSAFNALNEAATEYLTKEIMRRVILENNPDGFPYRVFRSNAYDEGVEFLRQLLFALSVKFGDEVEKEFFKAFFAGNTFEFLKKHIVDVYGEQALSALMRLRARDGEKLEDFYWDHMSSVTREIILKEDLENLKAKNKLHMNSLTPMLSDHSPDSVIKNIKRSNPEPKNAPNQTDPL